MEDAAEAPRLDRWAQWILRQRDGGDRKVFERRLPTLHEFRDRVLDNAHIERGDVLLDVGAGNGLIGFGALDRVGATGRVIFSDISEDLLQECRRIAEELKVLDRCDFVRASADDLRKLPDGSVDVVTTRSVLIYLSDKRPAFEEFFRVLRPGGRVSIFEPINSFGRPRPRHLFLGFDIPQVRDLVMKIQAQRVPHEQHPLLNFDERDLIRFAQEAGFHPVRLDYTAQVSMNDAPVTTDWETFKRLSANPLDPTLEEAMDAALSPEEKHRFEQHVRPLVENGAGRVEWSASAYIAAERPATKPLFSGNESAGA